jgi:hypothetical protein
MLLVFLAVVLFIIGAALSRRVDVSISLAAGAAACGVAAFGPGVLAATAAAFNTSMAYVLTSLILATALGFLLREQKARIASGLSAMGARTATFATPAAVGLLPMPGGAYISAVVVDPLWGSKPPEDLPQLLDEAHMHPGLAPLQGVLITAAVLGVLVWQVVEWAWPGALFAAAAGAAVAASLVKPVHVAGDPRDLTALWPLAAVAALSFLVPLPLAVAAVYLAYVVVNRVGRGQLAASLKYALNPRILAIIVFSLVFAQYIKESGLGAQLARALGPSSGLAVFLIPFAVDVATGVEFTFAGLAFLPISSFIHGPALAFAGGFLGVMLSPAHVVSS